MIPANEIPDDYDFTDSNPAPAAEKNYARLVLAVRDIRTVLDGPDQDEPIALRIALREAEGSLEYVLAGIRLS